MKTKLEILEESVNKMKDCATKTRILADIKKKKQTKLVTK
jgi:hypothetical protein